MRTIDKQNMNKVIILNAKDISEIQEILKYFNSKVKK